jgi:photosystem II stability/assembly factor-like uncharacterized protein
MKILKIPLVFLLVFNVAIVKAQWNVTMISYDFYFKEVLFLNDEVGFIAGGEYNNNGSWFDCCGAILRTLDGGNTWDTTLLETTIRSIHFIDNDTGFAASNQLLFYKTTDGGDNWETIVVSYPEPGIFSDNYFTSVHFKNSQEGYMCGHTGMSNDVSAFRTTDGGYTWEPRVHLFNSANQWLTRAQISFPTPTTGYVGNLYKTVDGGNTWYDNDSMLTAVPPGMSAHQCTDFFNANYGYIGSRYNTGIPQDFKDACLGVTYDGGINWNYHLFSELNRIYDIEIVDATTTYAAAWIGEPGDNTSPFIASLDAGNTWYYQSYAPDSLTPSIYQIHSIDDKVAYAVGAVGGFWGIGGEVVMAGVVLKTENSGGELLSMHETGERRLSKESFINIFPNPAKSSINIECNIAMENIEILNISGYRIQQLSVTNGKINVNISTLSKGTYFVKVSGKEKVIFDRFIKL